MSIELIHQIPTLRERVALLRLRGVLSLRDAAELKSSIKRLLKAGVSHLLLDFDGVTDMDEAGWAVLVSTVRKLRRSNGWIAIRNCSDALYDHLTLRKWDRDFLFPMRCAEHLAALPTDVRAWITGKPLLAGAV